MGVVGCCCKCVSTICCCIFSLIIAVVIVAVVCLCIFLIPRTPAYTVDFQGMDDYVLSERYFWMNVTYSVTLDNKNYIDAKLEKSDVDFYHQNDFIGNPTISETTWPKRDKTTRTVTMVVATTNQTVIAGINAEQPSKSFKIKGYLRAVYTGSKKMDLNDNFQVPMTATSG